MRYAICNETFGGWEHVRVCESVASLGYTGLEVAPFTLAPSIHEVSASQRSELRRVAEGAGLQIIGLHWLLAKTTGYGLTSPDADIRRHTGAYLAELARACRDLGGDILVLGSPMQRKIPDGYTHAEAEEFAADTIGHTLKVLEETGVCLALEPLAPSETDFLQTAESGRRLMAKIGHANVRLHLDVKAMSSEAEPIPELLREFRGELKHFHANDPNLRGPGFGSMDFVPIFAALKQIEYPGWVSVEVFDYSPDPETIARESLRYMRECESRAG